jgi:aspartyl-tRNA(Asn)/glutamyl-tRNA(Gln) amidotransferase subunit C
VSLTRAEVEKVALLARLHLTESEIDAMTSQLGRIVEYVALLNELSTDNVEPLAHPLDLVNVLADDQWLPGLEREEALSNAPKRDAECYRVPAVLGEDA